MLLILSSGQYGCNRPSGCWAHPYTIFSHQLDPAERNYSIWDKELLAIKAAFEEPCHLLEGARFLVRSSRTTKTWTTYARCDISISTRSDGLWFFFSLSFHYEWNSLDVINVHLLDILGSSRQPVLFLTTFGGLIFVPTPSSMWPLATFVPGQRPHARGHLVFSSFCLFPYS